MSAPFNFKPTPLSLAFKAKAVTLLMLMAQLSEARVVTGPDEMAGPGPRPDTFELRAGSRLTVLGVPTLQITANSATLLVNAGSSTRDIAAINSDIRIDGSDVVARDSARAGVHVTGSNVLITNSNITHNNGTGLAAARSLGATN
ncbi:MAG: autotransporter outer membrane beta-barrel domain-containing protein, partial [Pseudomonas sp.]|nr:autotransporter outer membrane beta-barrel domain-containing protein [Pseudomonas sp.]